MYKCGWFVFSLFTLGTGVFLGRHWTPYSSTLCSSSCIGTTQKSETEPVKEPKVIQGSPSQEIIEFVDLSQVFEPLRLDQSITQVPSYYPNPNEYEAIRSVNHERRVMPGLPVEQTEVAPFPREQTTSPPHMPFETWPTMMGTTVLEWMSQIMPLKGSQPPMGNDL